jgi:hypothetical protein
MGYKYKDQHALFVSTDSGSTYSRIYLLQSISEDDTKDTEEVTDLGLSDSDYAYPEGTKKTGTVTAEIIYADNYTSSKGYKEFKDWYDDDTELDFQIVKTKQTGTGIDATIEPVTASDVPTGDTLYSTTFKGIITGITRAMNAGEYFKSTLNIAKRGKSTQTAIVGTSGTTTTTTT